MSNLPPPGTVRSFGRCAHLVLAPNPGMMTLDGTNTWILLAPGSSQALLVDPGPSDSAHLDAVLNAVRDLGASVGSILLTHGHIDHSEAAPSLSAQLGVGVLAIDERHAVGDEALIAGDSFSVGGLAVDVIASPGHSSDSVSLFLPDDGSLLTGDTVLGRGTTVVSHPDGRLADYLSSLETLKGLAGVARVLPGHGPVIEDPAGALDYYISHRQQRLEQIRTAVAAGAVTAAEVVPVVYADVEQHLWGAATLSVLAQLEYLREVEGLPC